MVAVFQNQFSDNNFTSGLMISWNAQNLLKSCTYNLIKVTTVEQPNALRVAGGTELPCSLLMESD